MNKILLASTAALVLTAGYAAAEVTVTGDARMGVLEGYDFIDEGDNDDLLDNIDTDDIGFTSRIRIRFAASGETDGGLTFGGSVRVDHYDANGGNAVDGDAGSVFVSGGFGKLSMGDVDGAAEQAVGDVSGVGLTGLGDFNEFGYLSDADSGVRPAATYEYSTGALSFYASADNPSGTIGGVSDDPDDFSMYALGAKYTMNTYTFAIGYETGEIGDADPEQIIAGVTAGFGDFTVKAIYGSFDDALFGRDFGESLGDFAIPAGDGDQWGISLDYVMNATTLTAFYRTVDADDIMIDADGDVIEFSGDYDAYGIGAAYDLGGGASLKGGIVNVDPDNADSDTSYDFGVSMAF